MISLDYIFVTKKEMHSIRNVTFDYFKIFLSYLIILTHLQPLPFTNETLSAFEWVTSNGIARIAVPCFFILNGYFFYVKRDSKKKLYSYSKHLIMIYVVWTLIYLPYLNFNENIWYSFILPLFLGHLHLWYVIALVPALFIIYYINKIRLADRYKLFICLVLFNIGYYLELMFMEKGDLYGVNLLLCRNYLFIALPFVYIGFCIHKYQNKLIKVKDKAILIALTISILLLVLEAFYLYKPDRWPLDFLISLIVLCPILFVLVLKHSKYSAIDDGFTSKISEGVYFIHLISISLISLIPLEAAYLIKSFIVFFISILLSYCIIKVNERIKIFL